MHHFAFRMHHHGNNPACIDLRWLNVRNGCRVGTGRTARTFVAIAAWCAIDLTRSCYWCLMQYGSVCNFTSCAILLCEYATMTLKMGLHWSLLVECIKRVPWMNSTYVFSYLLSGVRLALLEVIIVVRCSLGVYVVLSHAPFCFLNTLIIMALH